MKKKSMYGKILVTGFFLLLFIIFFSKADRMYGWTSKELKGESPVLSDGAGYYAWLPSWIIYHDNSFEFLHDVQNNYPGKRFADNVLKGTEKPVNKYYTGTAVALSPFFMIAHWWASAGDYPADGYSFPYLFMISIGSVCYLITGCIAIYLLLRSFGIRKIWAVATVSVLVFGTNLSFYSFAYIPFSHVFSFAVNAWILFAARKWIVSGKRSYFLIVCALLGLAFIIRPTNLLLIVLLPFMSGSPEILKQKAKETLRSKFAIAGLLIFGAFVFFQVFQVHAHTGSWKLNTYTNEGFSNWNSPEIGNVLFSWGKGLFVYAPVLLLILPGMILLYKKERMLFYGTLLLLVILTYITASWWLWWYGGGLGMRPFIDFFPVMALPLALLFEVRKIVFRIAVIIFAVVSCQVYQVYEFQMKNHILDYDLMTYDQFRFVFMKKGLRYGWWTRQEYESLPDRKPVETISLDYSDQQGKIPNGKELMLSKDNPHDNPFLLIESRKEDRELLFGMKLSGDFYLMSDDATPYYELTYWKNGKQIRFNQFYFGQFFEQPENYEHMEMEVFPELAYEDFDSVKVAFMEGNTFAGAKKMSALQLSYPNNKKR